MHKTSKHCPKGGRDVQDTPERHRDAQEYASITVHPCGPQHFPERHRPPPGGSVPPRAPFRNCQSPQKTPQKPPKSPPEPPRKLPEPPKRPRACATGHVPQGMCHRGCATGGVPQGMCHRACATGHVPQGVCHRQPKHILGLLKKLVPSNLLWVALLPNSCALGEHKTIKKLWDFAKGALKNTPEAIVFFAFPSKVALSAHQKSRHTNSAPVQLPNRCQPSFPKGAFIRVH